MATKYASKGWVVKHGTTASPTTSLANVKSVRCQPGRRDMIKTTTHDSAATDDYVARPLRDTGEVEIVILWDPADTGHEAIRAAHAAGTKYYLTPIAPDAGTAQYAFSGYITDFTPGDMDADSGLMEATIRYKADSAETYTQ